jgi:tRNA(fMet)-specific endonuclease VapC
LQKVVKKSTRMIGNSILLDTNIISALLKGDTAIADGIDNALQVFIPVIVIGELYYGAQYSTQIEQNLSNIHRLIEAYEILKVDEDTAEIYGTIKSLLRKKGKPIPENDIWIAAIAHQHNLTLITRDKHFSEIENLDLISW